MPISSDRVGGVNITPLASFGSEPITTPAVADLMAAFRQGFVTVEDLAKRGAQLPVDIEKSRQSLQDERVIRPLSRQAQVGALGNEIQIQPRRQELQLGQIEQGIRALPTEGEQQASDAERAKSAQIRNSLVSSVPGVREKTIAQLSNDQVIDLWTAAHGQPPPDQLQTPGGGVSEPKPIDEFYLETFGEHPAGTRAIDNLNRPEVQTAYQKYVVEAKNRPLTVFRGDPNYIQALRDDLKQTDLKNAIQAAQLKALPGVLEQQAKAPGEQRAAGSKAAADLSDQIQKNDVLKPFRLRAQAVQQIRDLTSKPNPTNQDDLGLIYSVVRALDPVSAVREGEISLLQKGVGLPQNLVIQFNRLRGASNAVLTPSIRQGFAGLAETQAKSSAASALSEFQRFAGLAEKQGIPLEEVFTKPEIELFQSGTGSLAPVGQPTGAAPAGNQVQPGDIVTTRDGRKIRVKSVTATGVIPDETFVP
jgi:hypothetical protein